MFLCACVVLNVYVYVGLFLSVHTCWLFVFLDMFDLECVYSWFFNLLSVRVLRLCIFWILRVRVFNSVFFVYV